MGLLSVVIITLNEEKNIGRCIDSVKSVADEIIVLDSFSKDATVTIAREKGANVYQQPFAGYVAQKNRALEYASHDYVLSLDADEVLDERLIQSILEAKNEFAFKAYKINRCANYCGQFIRHGSWYPEAKIRLFDRRVAHWSGIDPHDRIRLKVNTPVSHLKGDILHYICDTIDDHIRRNENFSSIAAQSLFRLGKKASWLKMWASPSWFFLKDYILLGGFLSGYNGWVIAKNQARYHYLKYYKLNKLRKALSEARMQSKQEVKTG